MTLCAFMLSRPVGDFSVLVQEDPDRVIAAGFCAVEQLQERLPVGLRQTPIKMINDHPFVDALKDYFAGDVNALRTIPCEQSGTPFQKKVWQAMSEIPAGTTISYTHLARAAGNAAAVRAAGTACGQNQICLFVPCHRIVKSDGATGNYLYGSSVKEFLLAHEAKMALARV